MGNKKPDEWGKTLDDLIVGGKPHKEAEKELIALFGEEDGKLSAAAYQRHKKQLTGGPEVDKGLAEIKEIHTKEKPPKAKRAPWSKGKQKAADESKLAQLINKGMYHGLFPFCKNKQLTEEQVQDINLGGAVVGTIQHFVPDLNLDHPLVTLATRGIMLYIRFKAICSKAKELIEKVKTTVGGGSGIKPEFMEGSK